jgi:hypothetical protein
MKTKIFRSTFNQQSVELLLTALLVVLLIVSDVAVFAHPGPQPPLDPDVFTNSKDWGPNGSRHARTEERP